MGGKWSAKVWPPIYVIINFANISVLSGKGDLFQHRYAASRQMPQIPFSILIEDRPVRITKYPENLIHEFLVAEIKHSSQLSYQTPCWNSHGVLYILFLQSC